MIGYTTNNLDQIPIFNGSVSDNDTVNKIYLIENRKYVKFCLDTKIELWLYV